MTNTPGPFFAWRLARAIERYVSSFGRVRVFFENRCHLTQLRALSDTLTPTLLSFHQQEYYEQPRFHASFAWVLLDRPPQPTPSETPEPPTPLPASPSLGDRPSEDTRLFSTVPCLPETTIPALNAGLGSQLKGSAGIFEVGEVCIRIGKDVFGWELSG
jgi:hypothetical protein